MQASWQDSKTELCLATLIPKQFRLSHSRRKAEEKREKKLEKPARRQRHQHTHASGGSIGYQQKDKTELYLLLLFPHDFQPKHSLYKPLSCLLSCPFFQHLLPREWQNRAGGIFNSHRPASSFDQIQTSHLEKYPELDSDTMTPRYKVINKTKTGCYIANQFKFLTILC